MVKTIDQELEDLYAREMDLANSLIDPHLKSLHETLAALALAARNGGGARRQMDLFKTRRRRRRVPQQDKAES